MPVTRRITVLVARREGGCWRTARCPGCFGRTGQNGLRRSNEEINDETRFRTVRVADLDPVRPAGGGTDLTGRERAAATSSGRGRAGSPMDNRRSADGAQDACGERR